MKRPTSPDRRTLRRRKILAIAIEVLGSEEKAKQWLDSEIPSLNHRRPRDLVSTIQGAEEVTRILGCIEHGVYS